MKTFLYLSPISDKVELHKVVKIKRKYVTITSAVYDCVCFDILKSEYEKLNHEN